MISDICYLRLDFESFTIVGPTLSTEGVATTYTCPDQFKVTVSMMKLSQTQIPLYTLLFF
jgi:hypothetical protein